MAKPVDEIPRIEHLDAEKHGGEAKQGEAEKENVVAIDAAENEGLPVVGLGDEELGEASEAKVVVIKPAANDSSLSLFETLDARESKRKQA